MLDDRSPVPLYHQLHQIIRARIQSGYWGAGDRLPVEEELCAEFDVSRATVRQALQSLVREGLVRRRRGKGSFVSPPRITQDLLSFSSFSAYAREKMGSELCSRLLSVKLLPADSPTAESLDIPDGATVVEVRKVKLAGEQPIFLSTLRVPRHLCPGLETEDHTGDSLVDLLQARYGYPILRIRGSFDAVCLRAAEARLLEVEEGTPAILYKRVRYTMSERPLLASTHVIRGDLCNLAFDLSSAGDR